MLLALLSERVNYFMLPTNNNNNTKAHEGKKKNVISRELMSDEQIELIL